MTEQTPCLALLRVKPIGHSNDRTRDREQLNTLTQQKILRSITFSKSNVQQHQAKAKVGPTPKES